MARRFGARASQASVISSARSSIVISERPDCFGRSSEAHTDTERASSLLRVAIETNPGAHAALLVEARRLSQLAAPS